MKATLDFLEFKINDEPTDQMRWQRNDESRRKAGAPRGKPTWM